MVTLADGTAERDAALLMASQIPGCAPVTLGGDKNYDTQELVRDLREMKVTPHVAQNNTNGGVLFNWRSDDRASGLCDQPEETQTDRRELRLDEDHRHAKEG